MEGCEILEQIAKMGKYCEADAQGIFKQVLEGLAYLHSERVCHRDIKPSNILITEDKKVYIADFNVAKDCRETQPSKEQEISDMLLTDKIDTKKQVNKDSIQTTSSFGSDIDEDSLKMLTRGAGTLAFAAPERLSENCVYT